MDVVNYLLGYKNLKIVQNTDYFNFSLDSVLLANFVTLNKSAKKIIDIGTGNAPIPLILSTKTNADIIGIEIQEKSAILAQKSVDINSLNDRIEIVNDDVMNYYKLIESDTIDIITCNPPFFKVSSNSRLNDKEEKTIARHEIHLDIDRLMKVAKKVLKNNGNIAIVHRPERMLDVINNMLSNNIQPKRIQFVYPTTSKSANILLIEGTKNGRPGLEIMPPLFVHNENGDYTEEVLKYFS